VDATSFGIGSTYAIRAEDDIPERDHAAEVTSAGVPISRRAR